MEGADGEDGSEGSKELAGKDDMKFLVAALGFIDAVCI